MLVFMAQTNKMLVSIANREDPDNTAFWVCTVFLGLLLVFEILEYLPFINAVIQYI